jgi:hypothetical protein
MASRPPSRTPLAGGAVIAVAVLAGAFIGAGRGQPSLGFVIGAAIGAAIALAIWAVDRMRGN